jgi:hypothetical protein
MYSAMGEPSRRNAYDGSVSDEVTLTDLYFVQPGSPGR